VLKAVENVNKKIAPKALIGLDSTDQLGRCDHAQARRHADEKEPRRERHPRRFARHGAGRGAKSVGLPLYKYLGGPNAKTLPVPLANVLNGGAHSDAPIDFQEYMIVPKGAPTFSEAIRYGAEVYHSLKKVLHDEKLGTGGGDEGGFAPRFKSNEHALEVLALAVKKAGYKLGKDIFFALDVASSEFFDKETGKYIFKKSDGSKKTAEEMIALYQDLAKRYPIISIEDGMAENDWAGWKKLTDAMGKTTQLVGDDLFVTNVEFLQKGIDQGVGNSILVKVNQIGSLTETFDAVELAKRNGYTSSSAIAPAKARTRPSPTSRWRSTSARSRPAPSRAPTVSPSTTSSSASKKNSAATPSSEARFLAGGGEHDDRDVLERGVGFHLAQDFHAVHLRHFQIEQHHDGQPLGAASEDAAAVKVIEGLGAVVGDIDMVGEVAFLQRHQGQLHIVLAVLHQEDSFH
jgi:enolase